MGREISLFADYSQKENRTTNYCGLILKMLYGENPEAFEECINNMVQEELKTTPSFSQQNRSGESVPDLQIKQNSFNIIFETKNVDWFYSKQIIKHIEGLNLDKKDLNVLFLITSQFKTDIPEKEFEKEIDFAKNNNVLLKFITFEEFINTIYNLKKETSNAFSNTLSDFEDYLSRNNLLPTWKYTLDVVNCAGSKHYADEGIYVCPDKGGSYNHKRAKFLGAYWDKNVHYISEIEGVVVLTGAGDVSEIKWNNTIYDSNYLEKRAGELYRKLRQPEKDSIQKDSLQLFILSNTKELSYKKVSSGGMMCSKRYFIQKSDIKDVEDLREALNNKTWE